ncbi:1-deoxy-D-xylulose 5-phosphate reductoisomerase [Thermodesulfobium narugense DSM 14796]|uniref:1-deoxy-D-xylulose 5-phosphate reductoisomerase n=1 Tax=Thermodesulfobium narugense DSM 14796 TaxID=747365 RepID=M1E8A1_9BACT|nr:1-deoxy-D-xylulose-5-phosphate reductoisomerase [Thermodesulfobium narugense]AEE14349.1 1-deoxy-D-xylulose 5-phosphate reductoisomerase [Thermodesulfobium narugense DSM 14796]
MKKIILIGSTGSIGTQALEVVRKHSDKLKVVGLAARKISEKLRDQIREFQPECVGLLYKEDFETKPEKTFYGFDGILEMVRQTEADLVLLAWVGKDSIYIAKSALDSNKDLAFATKEILVYGGNLIVNYAKKVGRKILPVDSEHNAIFQLLENEDISFVDSIYLTASGGPFYNKHFIKSPSVDEVLSHPTWKMGPKVTVDSANLMNKGFEVIEASFLFGFDPSKIKVLINRTSLVHSLISFLDGSVRILYYKPDMRIPIQHVLSYPERWVAPQKEDFENHFVLEFEKPNNNEFPCLALAYEALEGGSIKTASLAACDEVLVDAFLNKKISFLSIPKMLELILSKSNSGNVTSFEEIDLIYNETVARSLELLEAYKI